jgi:type II secretory pathway component PulL
MPADKEIHLCVVGPNNVFSLANALQVPLIHEEDEVVTDVNNWDQNTLEEEWDSPAVKSVGARLEQAWLEAVAEKGWTIAGRDGDYYILDTPWGKRQAHPFSMCLQFDPFEIGDRAEDVTYGVGLSSRYFPRFLDMADAHGTLGSAIDFDELSDDIALAREKILKHVPELEGAKTVFRDIFY